MKITTLPAVLLTGLSALALTSLAHAQEGAVWNDINGGSLGNSTMTTTGFTAGSTIAPSDLSGSFYSFAPLSASQDTVSYHCNDTWSADFSPAISGGLLWYGVFIRGAGASPTGAEVEYTFNHPPVIVSGFSQGSISGNTFKVPVTGFHWGILMFTGSVESSSGSAIGTLSCSTNATGIHYQNCTFGTPETPGTPFCFGDGTSIACPCGNTGGADQGCANTTGSGALLATSGSDSASTDDLAFAAANLPPVRASLLFSGTMNLGGGNGIHFGDGLRCAGGNIVRLGVHISDVNGTSTWGPGLATSGGWGAGDTRSFQVWYRDTGGPCGSGFNISHGTSVVFTP